MSTRNNDTRLLTADQRHRRNQLHMRSAQSDCMRSTFQRGLSLQAAGDHNFGINKGTTTNTSPSPTLAPSGIYYMECVKCGRAVFEDGSGSATESTCRK